MMYKYEEQVIGDIAKVKGGKRLPKGKNLISIPNSHPYIRIRDLGKSKILELTDDYEFVDDATQSTISKYVVEKDDIVISIVGTIGLVGVVGATLHDANLTENCVKLTNISEHVDRGYLYYYLISPMGQVEISKGTVGAVQPKLPIKNIQNIKIVLPPLDVQKKVASILSAIDDKIRVNEAINHNLEQQAEALYKKTFPYSVRDELPDNWHIGTVRDIIDLHDSKRIPLSGRERDKMTMKIYPYYGATSVMDHVEAYIFDGCYLLLGEDGTVIDDYGHPILQYVWGKFWVNNHAHIISGKNGFMVESLYLFFKQLNVRSIVTGAVQPKISQANLCSVPVVIPPEEVIRAFNEQIMPFFTMIRTNTDENARLSSLRDSLLPRIMAGEIDVSDIDI